MHAIDEFFTHLVNQKLFRLKDIRDSTIWGLLYRGKEKGWIIHNMPGLKEKNRIAYNTFLRHSDLSDLPDDIRKRLEQENKYWKGENACMHSLHAEGRILKERRIIERKER